MDSTFAANPEGKGNPDFFRFLSFVDARQGRSSVVDSQGILLCQVQE